MPAVKIIIFNVEHGFCSFIKSPNGYAILIDCGKRENFSPIKYILENEMDGIIPSGDRLLTKFILTHPHDDHLNDIERLISEFNPRLLVSEEDYIWESLKIGDEEKYKNLDIYSEWQKDYKYKPVTLPKFGIDIIYSCYLRPPKAVEISKDEKDYVNNSSIPVIIKFEGTKYKEKILFGGDLMKEGWLELLKDRYFKENLKNVDLFVTSHHGHSTGYCKEVFDAMGRNPFLNIVSAHSKDESVDSAYSSSSIGAEINGEKRFMLSTRKDGDIIIEINSEGRFSVRTENFGDNIRTLDRWAY